MSRKKVLTPRKGPLQARSRVTVEAILEATARILEREGPEALNTNDIAKLAGVSVGSLYQYFPNKHAILAALILDDATRLSTIVGDAVSSSDPIELRLRNMIEAAMAHQNSRPRLSRVLDDIEERLEISDELTRVQLQLRTIIASNLQEYGVPPEDIPTSTLDVFAIARGMSDTAVKAGLEDDLSERITRAIFGYLSIYVRAPTKG